MLERNWAFDFYIAPKILEYANWLELSDQHSKFTCSVRNVHHLIGRVSCVTGASAIDVASVIQEVIDDKWLTNLLVEAEHKYGSKSSADRIKTLGSHIFGRRLGWYTVVRL
jgi:hypothetical protein